MRQSLRHFQWPYATQAFLPSCVDAGSPKFAELGYVTIIMFEPRFLVTGLPLVSELTHVEKLSSSNARVELQSDAPRLLK